MNFTAIDIRVILRSGRAFRFSVPLEQRQMHVCTRARWSQIHAMYTFECTHVHARTLQTLARCVRARARARARARLDSEPQPGVRTDSE